MFAGGDEDEADNYEINADRAIKGSCESSRIEPFICYIVDSADLVSKGFHNKKIETQPSDTRL